MTAVPTALDALRADTDAVFSPWVRALGLTLVDAGGDFATFTLPVSPALVHGGGVLCGQALMAAADTAMVVALSSAHGGFRPMTTVQLQTSFLAPVPPAAGTVTVTATVLRRGKRLCFGEIAMTLPDGTLAAHATTTYAML